MSADDDRSSVPPETTRVRERGPSKERLERERENGKMKRELCTRDGGGKENDRAYDGQTESNRRAPREGMGVTKNKIDYFVTAFALSLSLQIHHISTQIFFD